MSSTPTSSQPHFHSPDTSFNFSHLPKPPIVDPGLDTDGYVRTIQQWVVDTFFSGSIAVANRQHILDTKRRESPDSEFPFPCSCGHRPDCPLSDPYCYRAEPYPVVDPVSPIYRPTSPIPASYLSTTDSIIPLYQQSPVHTDLGLDYPSSDVTESPVTPTVALPSLVPYSGSSSPEPESSTQSSPEPERSLSPETSVPPTSTLFGVPFTVTSTNSSPHSSFIADEFPKIEDSDPGFFGYLDPLESSNLPGPSSPNRPIRPLPKRAKVDYHRTAVLNKARQAERRNYVADLVSRGEYDQAELFIKTTAPIHSSDLWNTARKHAPGHNFDSPCTCTICERARRELEEDERYSRDKVLPESVERIPGPVGVLPSVHPDLESLISAQELDEALTIQRLYDDLDRDSDHSKSSN